MFGLGTGELIIIGAVLFLVVGPKKLPKYGSALAQGIRNFRNGMADAIDDKAPEPEVEKKEQNIRITEQ